jgi:hypothetical protein
VVARNRGDLPVMILKANVPILGEPLS